MNAWKRCFNSALTWNLISKKSLCLKGNVFLVDETLSRNGYRDKHKGQACPQTFIAPVFVNYGKYHKMTWEMKIHPKKTNIRQDRRIFLRWETNMKIHETIRKIHRKQTKIGQDRRNSISLLDCTASRSKSRKKILLEIKFICSQISVFSVSFVSAYLWEVFLTEVFLHVILLAHNPNGIHLFSNIF